MTEISTVIVGTSFKGQQAVDAVGMMAVGQAVRLVRDRGNRYDANAVACHYLGISVGFVPRVANPRVAAAMDAGAEPVAFVTAPATVNHGRSGLRVKVEPKIKISWGD